MKKIQVPVMGGFRKVVYPGAAASVGTTIAEVGSGTITLTQLAAAINNILQGSGSISTGSSNAANLVVGPGLSGGGILVGNVPLRITAPIPWSDDGGGGADGDPGPPGQAGAPGVAGIQGPTGPTLMVMIPEDGQDGETVPGPAGTPGAAGATGSIGPTGPSGATGPTGGILFPEDGADGDWGPPGVPGATGATGATGSQGPQGPTGSSAGGSAMIADDPMQDDGMIGFHQQYIGGQLSVSGFLNALTSISVGTTGASNASIVFYGATPSIIATAAGAVLSLKANTTLQLGVNNPANLLVNSNGQITMGNSAATQLIVAPGTATATGIISQAGSAESNLNMQWQYSTGAVLAELRGDGGMIIGAGVAAFGASYDKGFGTLNVQNGYYLNGAPLFGGGNANNATIAHGMIPDEPLQDDGMMAYPPNTLGGPLQVNGGFISSGMATFTKAAESVKIVGDTAFQNFRMTTGMSIFQIGLNTGVIGAGSNSDAAFLAIANMNFYVTSTGAKIMTLAPTLVATFASSGIFASSVGTQGVTPAVTAGQTDLGITTTVTVITTAGGIALPALASVFGVINWNGVKYGVPLFAL